MTIANEPLSSGNVDAAHAVLSQLRAGLTIDSLSKFIGHPDYRFLVFQSHGGVVAVCGYRLLVTITRGKALPSTRSGGRQGGTWARDW